MRMQFLDDPRGGERLWRLLSGNNRPLAMGRGGSRAPRDELAAVRRLVREAEPKLRRDPDGKWRWEISANGGPDVQCPGVFARRVDARRAFHRFTQAVEQAEVTSAQLSPVLIQRELMIQREPER
ncbi:hypothetical protein EV643_111162 [Kribbella sp. VKM Ac-2527]|uniref:DUF1508 domain-containing protein n=1 Tax=Kribbella caucasensis TaxID=2512215 RepID=A0A4R6K9A2_9ACTN|nr:hypothetical protein EV643_111162 [Kribbella sp. VKM Ac-2527]